MGEGTKRVTIETRELKVTEPLFCEV